MSTQTREPSLRDRVEQRPHFSLSRVRETTAKELGIRFAAGALTSVVAGVVTLLAGARVGGILLAFPAIMAASLTLIEEVQDSTQAREDARGAIVGASALTLFAVLGALCFGHLPGGVVLALATAVWVVGAALGYVVVSWR
jgi:Protein of unknown function (DUF3147)